MPQTALGLMEVRKVSPVTWGVFTGNGNTVHRHRLLCFEGTPGQMKVCEIERL
jgi:hypothetical protein